MFDSFQPDQSPRAQTEIPFFEDISPANGWEGMTTQKSTEKLTGEIREALGFLGAEVTGFLRGKFGERPGYRITMVITGPDGKTRKGQIDVVSLPCKPTVRYRRGSSESFEKRQEKSLRTALFNFRDYLEGVYRLRFIQPGYDPLMAWTLTDSGKTVMHLWNEQTSPDHLLTDTAGGDEMTIDGEVRDVKE